MQILEAFFNYAKERSFGRLLLDFILLLAVVTWIGLGTLFVSNFTEVTTLIDTWMKSDATVTSTLSESIFRKNIILNTNIDNELYRLIENTNSQRAYVSRFHDGKVDIRGSHFVFSSRTHEVSTSGISKEFHRNQNIPLAIFNNFSNKYLQKDCIVLNNIEEATNLTQFFQEQGIKSLIRCPVYSSDDTLIGFIGVDYINLILDPKHQSNYVQFVKNTAYRIGGMLSITDKNN